MSFLSNFCRLFFKYITFSKFNPSFLGLIKRSKSKNINKNKRRPAGKARAIYSKVETSILAALIARIGKT